MLYERTNPIKQCTASVPQFKLFKVNWRSNVPKHKGNNIHDFTGKFLGVVNTL